jgi:prepilin-type N-terminal cleavage/methylation domain-containing protein
MKKNNFKASQGFSLIELLLVLAIIAALAVAAFVIYPRVQAGRSATYEAQVLSSAQASVKALFTNNNYAALNEEVALKGKFFPDNMTGQIDDGVNPPSTVIRNQFDGLVALTGADAAGGAVTTPPARFFAITYEDVPTEVCIKLAGSAVQNFNGVTVGGQVVKAAATGAITEANIVTGCSDAATVDMVFISN